jgi:hypothetical protein
MDALDAVIDEQWKQLQTNKKRLIENATRREQRQAENDGKYENLAPEQTKELDKRIRKEAESDPTYDEDDRIFTLTLESQDKVKDVTIKGAAEHAECQSQYIKKLDVSLVCGGVKVNLAVPSVDKGSELQIVTLPEGSEQAKEAFVKLAIWAENYRPSWVRIVNGFPSVLIFPLFAILLLPCMLLVSITAPPRPSLQDEARDLVKKGITPAEYGKALTILLRRGSEPDKADLGLDEVPLWFWAAMALILTLAGLLSFTATTAFEIGKGKRSVAWQKWHGNLLRKWVPGIIIPIALSIIAAIIYEHYRRQ